MILVFVVVLVLVVVVSWSSSTNDVLTVSRTRAGCNQKATARRQGIDCKKKQRRRGWLSCRHSVLVRRQRAFPPPSRRPSLLFFGFRVLMHCCVTWPTRGNKRTDQSSSCWGTKTKQYYVRERRTENPSSHFYFAFSFSSWIVVFFSRDVVVSPKTKTNNVQREAFG